MTDATVFFKTDCPTCTLAVPALARLPGLRLRAVSQSSPAETEAWLDELGCRLDVDYDTDLLASADAGFDTVPALYVGEADEPIVGWDREAIAAALTAAGIDVPAGVFDGLPDLKPGCASNHLSPEHHDRIRVRREAGRLRSRRVTLGQTDDPYEFAHQAGWSDGLPVVPPTASRVLRMLDGTSRDPGEEVAAVPPSLRLVTVEKVAVNAVLAGCAPEHLPVVLAAVEAACSEEFALQALLATTHSVGPLVVVNGPARRSLNMNAGLNVLGQGNRANATIGRALQLVVRNVGGGRPGEIDRATLGQPGKVGFCFAEHEEASPWEPLHTQLGGRAGASAVTLFAAEAPRLLYDHNSRTADSLAASFGMALDGVAHPKVRWSPVPTNLPVFGAMLVLSPEHARTFAEAGWSKAQVRDAVLAASARPAAELVRDGACQEGLPADAVPDPDARIPKLPPDGSEGPWIVVAGGGAGKHSAVIGGWRIPPLGSAITTREIQS